MTTTSHFQKKSDYYYTVEECLKASRVKTATNPRYSDFFQTHFTAGDEDQFQEYRDTSNGDVCISRINLDTNKFSDIDLSDDISWAKYQNLNATCVNNTFQYMFQKLKKGIFVKIQDNKVKVFLPFSKKGFVNEWGNKIKIDPKFGNMHNFLTHINKMMGKKYKVSVNRFPDNWYANNCLVRTEFPINEGDTNNSEMSDMLNVLCANRKIPDMEFFVNRRDFPVIKKNGTEPYNHMFGNNQPLLSHDYDQYSPILSMVTTDEYADVPIPTGDDWSRVGSYEGKFFGNDCKTFPTVDQFNIEWKDKKPTAVFRGASTGCGVTIETNNRLKLAYMSVMTPPDVQGPLLDAGITKWNVRPRKLDGEKYLQTIDVPEMNKKGVSLASFLTPLQQSGYKYLVHVDGHVSAFRLSLEMSMGCCILLADSKYRLWFKRLMKPMVDYVPVKADLSDLLEKIVWCRENDKKCEKIAKNARKFYMAYLQKDGMLDYLQKIIIELKSQAGVYLYNTETPLQHQIKMEKDLDLYYPVTEKKISDIGTIPRQARSYGILKGMEWIINMVNKESTFTEVAKKGELVFSNKAKTVMVQKYTLAGFSFVIKATTDVMKQQENIHEAFIGTKVINDIIKYIPNFAYVFGKFNGPTDNIVIMEYIFGQTFDKWLQSDKFNMQDYIFILIQLAMALEVAQSVGGFVHYDLAPWNIVIQESPRPISFDYMLDGTNVFRVNTKLIPVIIDYGKSHVIYENKHHGYINMYKMSTIQDIISILLSSLNIITQFDLSKKNQNEVIKIANFMSGTGYHQKQFKIVSDVQFFIARAKKYAELISSDKHELEQMTPRDFIKYVSKTFTYKFTYEKIDSPVFRINRGNPRQVFEYVLSSSPEEKTKSFLDVFDRVIECEFPEPVNLFFSYYAAQSLEESITAVYTLMTQYLKDEKLTEVGSKRYKKAIKKIKRVYTEKLQANVDEKVEYELSEKFGKLEMALYTEETFLIPDVVLNLLHKYEKKDDKDLSDYKYIIEQVFLNQGMFKMSDEHREYYLENFASLLEVNSVNMKTDCANVHTLRDVARCIYLQDKGLLEKKLQKKKLKKQGSLPRQNCVAAEEQMTTYNKIVEYFNKNEEEKKIFDRRYAITFGEVAVLHIGGAELGKMKDHGFSVDELREIKRKLDKKGVKTELYMLSDVLPENLREANEAATLVIRDAANYMLKSSTGADELYEEQKGVRYDTMFYAPRKKQMNNKQARYNIVFGDEKKEQYLSNYDGVQRTNTIVVDLDEDVLFSVEPFDDLPYLSGIREGLSGILGPEAKDLNAEGNYYYEEKSGLGYHGDSERKIVIGLSLGNSAILRYNWRLPNSSAHPFPSIDLVLNHGDIYVMSEKATGNDWNRRSKVRVVHAAGHKSYIDKGFKSLEEESAYKKKKSKSKNK